MMTTGNDWRRGLREALRMFSKQRLYPFLEAVAEGLDGADQERVEQAVSLVRHVEIAPAIARMPRLPAVDDPRLGRLRQLVDELAAQPGLVAAMRAHADRLPTKQLRTGVAALCERAEALRSS